MTCATFDVANYIEDLDHTLVFLEVSYACTFLLA